MIRQICSTFIVILGLNSLVSDFVEFVDFVQDIQDVYGDFRLFVFSLLDFSLPVWCQDYLIVGLALSSSQLRADFDHPGPLGQSYSSSSRWIGAIISFLFGAIFWPLLLIINIAALPLALRGGSVGDGLIPAGQITDFFRSAIISAGCFLVLLFVFSDILIVLY